jgi:hypothetical protein
VEERHDVVGSQDGAVVMGIVKITSSPRSLLFTLYLISHSSILQLRRIRLKKIIRP